MNTNRRDFLRIAGLTGAGMFSGALSSCVFNTDKKQSDELAYIEAQANKTHSQRFNMCGYAAPRMEVVRIGFIGLGMRGPGAVERMSYIDGVEIKALCDLLPDRVDSIQQRLVEIGLPPAELYSGGEEAWKDMCLREDIDLVYICTPWDLHTPMALFAMENGKHAAIEVPACTTLEEAWQLVETSERTRMHCMMLENCCYDFFELLTLNMARQGFFGDIVHTEAAYIHDLRDLNFSKTGYYPGLWRLRENQLRNGNLYPTHGLGPVCQVLNINRGDKMDYLSSMSSADFQLADMAADLAAKDSFFEEFKTTNYRGNMNTTMIRTEKGKTIMLQHDTTSPRPYSRIHLLSGTRGIALKYPQERIANGHQWINDAGMQEIREEFMPDIVKLIGQMAQKVGGHGGMDFIMDWRLIDCLRNGLPLDQDVYDAALWSSIAPLSEWSVVNRSNSITVPDFSCGAYKTNSPVDVSLEGGGNTGIREKAVTTEVQLNV